MINWIAGTCAIAGFLIIILGFILGLYGMQTGKEFKEYVTRMMAELMPPKSGQAAAPSAQQGATQGSTLSANEVSEVVRALAEFAKSLTGLPQAIQAFLISIILFLFAAVLVGGTTFVR